MADKFRDVFPVPVTFVKGEQPESDKLNGWASQEEVGFQLLERAIGNVWSDETQVHAPANGSGPYVLSRQDTRTSQIVNLAGLIGPASALNPRTSWTAGTAGEVNITSSIPNGVNEFTLAYPPIKINAGSEAFPALVVSLDTLNSSGHIRYELNNLDASVFGTRKNTKSEVIVSGDYCIDLGGRVFTFKKTPAAGSLSVTYKTYLYPDSYDRASFNVIPDVNQTSPLCAVTEPTPGSGIYQVVLPVIEGLSSFNENGSIAEPIADFQARLPYVLERQLQANDIIPDGFIYLWDTQPEDVDESVLDKTGGVLLENLTYTYVDYRTFKVSGAALEDGSTDRYRVITIGTTVTELLASLRDRLDRHDHSDVKDGKPISHSSLSGCQMVAATGYGLTIMAPPSKIPGNDHPQYMSRFGWVDNVDPGQHDNALLGDLFIAAEKTDYSTIDSYQDAVSVASRKIRFTASTGPYIGNVNDGAKGKFTISAPQRMSIVAAEELEIKTTSKTLTIENTSAIATEFIKIRSLGSLVLTTTGTPTMGVKSIYIGAYDTKAHSLGQASVLIVAGTPSYAATVPAEEIRLFAKGNINLIAEGATGLMATGNLQLQSDDNVNINAETGILTLQGGAVHIEPDTLIEATSITSTTIQAGTTLTLKTVVSAVEKAKIELTSAGAINLTATSIGFGSCLIDFSDSAGLIPPIVEGTDDLPVSPTVGMTYLVHISSSWPYYYGLYTWAGTCWIFFLPSGTFTPGGGIGGVPGDAWEPGDPDDPDEPGYPEGGQPL